MADGTLIFDTSLNTDGLQKGVGGLGSVAKTALGVFTGNVMTKAAGAVANLGKEALSSGMSFEHSMAKVNTLFAGTDEQFDQLGADIKRISSETGLAADGLAEAAYSAESAGVSVENLGSMLENSSKLAAAGFTDVDTALSATAKTMNAYGMEGEEAIGQVQKVLMQTQNLGITTVGELGASLAQVTPTAAAFGVSFEQVGASLAVMTAAGTPTAQATTQLNSLIAELGKSGTTAAKNLTEAAKGTEYAGMSFNEMMEAGADLSDVLGMLDGKAKKDKKSMVDMFSSIEAGKAALSIFSEEGETFSKNLGEMSTGADVVGEAYGKMAETLEMKTARIKSSFQNMAISIFEQAAGPLADGAEKVAGILSTMQDSFNEGGFAGVADAITGTMNNAATAIATFDWSGAASTIATRISEFIKADGVGKMIDAAGSILLSLAQGIAEMMPTLLPAILNLMIYLAGCVLQGGSYLLEAVADLIDGLFNAIGEWLAPIIDTVARWGSDMISTASSAISSMVTAVTDWISQLPGNMWTWLVNTVTRLVAWGQNMLTTASTAMSNMLSAVVKWVSQMPSKVWTWLSNTVAKVTEFGTQMKKKATEAAKGFVKNITDGLKNLPSEMKKIGDNIVKGIWEGISGGWDWLKEKVSGLAKGLLDSAKNALGIHSPSRAFADEVGNWIPAGIGVGMDKAMPAALKDMKRQAAEMVAGMKATVEANASDLAFKVSTNASINAAGTAGTTVYNDNHVEQENTYNVPVASPSEIAKSQREAVRKLVGGVA